MHSSKLLWLPGLISAPLWVMGMLTWRYLEHGTLTNRDVVAGLLAGVLFYGLGVLIKWLIFVYLRRSTTVQGNIHKKS